MPVKVIWLIDAAEIFIEMRYPGEIGAFEIESQRASREFPDELA